MAAASGGCSLDRLRASPRYAFHANDGRLYDLSFQHIFGPFSPERPVHSRIPCADESADAFLRAAIRLVDRHPAWMSVLQDGE